MRSLQTNDCRVGHVCLFKRYRSIDTGRIWIKFGMGVMQLRFPIKSYFSIPMIGNTNMADEQTCDVGSTLAPLSTAPYNDVCYRI